MSVFKDAFNAVWPAPVLTDVPRSTMLTSPSLLERLIDWDDERPVRSGLQAVAHLLLLMPRVFGEFLPALGEYACQQWRENDDKERSTLGRVASYLGEYACKAVRVIVRTVTSPSNSLVAAKRAREQLKHSLGERAGSVIGTALIAASLIMTAVAYSLACVFTAGLALPFLVGVKLGVSTSSASGFFSSVVATLTQNIVGAATVVSGGLAALVKPLIRMVRAPASKNFDGLSISSASGSDAASLHGRIGPGSQEFTDDGDEENLDVTVPSKKRKSAAPSTSASPAAGASSSQHSLLETSGLDMSGPVPVPTPQRKPTYAAVVAGPGDNTSGPSIPFPHEPDSSNDGPRTTSTPRGKRSYGNAASNEGRTYADVVAAKALPAAGLLGGGGVIRVGFGDDERKIRSPTPSNSAASSPSNT